MARLHSDTVAALLELAGPNADEILTEMEQRATREGFPIVGAEVGRTLALCARLRGTKTVFELGSGFGYSAYWIARVLPEEGTITLTGRDAGLLADAEAYFERGSLAQKATFAQGDAITLAREARGPFNLVVLDHNTADYVEGFEAVRDAVAPGGAIIADNVLSTDTEQPLTPAGLEATLSGEPAPNERTRAVAAYFDYVSHADGFETYALPVGQGIAVSCRI
ncbi:O-methyltransferase [Haladaptatus sp. CMSO5]|uniref:O-methyltransferase n=1 Tax=Haladaptatus sp. CMSO5 TaxID=3120514 RepID=UPI002FCE43E7